jgi:cytochrome c oxidase assembly protein subunit 15
MDTPTPHIGKLPVLAPAVVYGFGAASALWTVWFVTHIPWTGLSPAVQTALSLAAWLLAMIYGGYRLCSSFARAIKIGAMSGVVTSLASVFMLGAKIVPSNENEKPAVLLMVGGFVGLGVAIGVVGSALGAAISAARSGGRSDSAGGRSEPDWHASFALVMIAWAAPLLFVGGLVTSTNSGMAVPDWPNTYGANMFLYPLGSAPADVFLEHSHRLFAWMLGVTALVNFFWTLRTETRRWVMWWSLLIGLAILSQALLGGVRVLKGSSVSAEDNRWWSMAHGIGSQLVFALIVAFAVYVTPLYKHAGPAPVEQGARRLRGLSTGALHSTFLQMIFGAMYRHTRSAHALWSHAGFAIVVMVLTIISGFLSLRQRKLSLENVSAAGPSTAVQRTLGTAGTWQLVTVSIQFILGWVIFAVGGTALTAANPGEALLRTLHQANGALLVAVTTVVVVLSRRIAPKKLK